MISWLVARSDGADYGKLLNYKLPKDKLIYGPLQIESRIDQDTAISSQLSLWNQQGSQVLRGNLLVIPVGDSFLYVEPLYLQAQGSNPLPELKRVIVAAGNKIAMTETLETSLNQIFTGSSTTPGGVVSTLPPPSAIQPSGSAPAAPSAAPSVAAAPTVAAPSSAVPAASAAPLPNVPPEIGALTRDANDHYNRAQDALKSGDFATYGQEMKQVQADLQRLNQLSGQ
jgi:uncharacterized membrane protein (UPF0182 family)